MRRPIIPCLALASLSLLACDQDEKVSTAPSTPEAPAVATAAASLPFRQISGGGGHTCAVTTANKAYCWGENASGQLGDGTTARRLTPVPVAGGHLFRHVSGGNRHTCGVTTDTRVYCWGGNDRGQLGDGTASRRTRPVPVMGTRHFQQVEVGGNHSCAINAADQRAFCWGDNSFGQLGVGTRVERRLSPVAVAGGRAFHQVSAGQRHTCAVTSTGAAYCWGRNTTNQLGDGTAKLRLAPVAVAGGHSFSLVSAGGAHTCAVTPGARAFCWGGNGDGQIGDGLTTNRATPTAVTGGLSFTRVTAGVGHSCGETTGKRAYCWGDNVYGELGIGDEPAERKLVPTAVVGNLLFAQVNASAGIVFTCGVTTGSVAYCWGNNLEGQLGDGTTTNRTAPVPVGG